MITKLNISAIVLLTAAFSGAAVRTRRNPLLPQAQLDSNGPSLIPNDINTKSVQSPIATSYGFPWLQTSSSSNSINGNANPSFAPLKPEVLGHISLPVPSGIHQPITFSSIIEQPIPSGVESSKKCLRSNGQFPTESCNKFINCWNGVATEQACPEGLLFDARGLYCDYPERVDCNQKSLVNPQHPVFPQQPVLSAAVATVQKTEGPASHSPVSDHTVQTTHILPLTSDATNQGCIQARGQFPTDICNKYLNCWDGASVEQFCPLGLVFNPSKLHCDFPENVNCNGKLIIGSSSTNTLYGNVLSTTSTPYVQPSPIPTIFTSTPSVFPPTNLISNVNEDLKKKCLNSRGTYPSSACNRFVVCKNGVVEEKECPAGFLFSTNGYCDAAENVNCGGRTITTKDSGNELACPKVSGTFRDKDRCNSYYTCVFNKVVARFQCPEGLHFNEKIGVCDYADRVECSKETSISQHKDNSKSSDCPLENGTFREKSKCNAYYTCISKKIVAKYVCPEGFNFNDNIGVCDYASRVDCSKEPLIYQRKDGVYFSSSQNDVVGTDCPVEFGTYRDSRNCSLYYTCASRKIVAKYNCPEGFSFNDDIGVCDYAERVDCSKPPKMFQIKPNGVAQFPSNFQEKVDRCTSGSMFRLNPQCTAACLCRNGVAEIVQCPAGLAYDSRLDKCIVPHLARC